jgi:peptide/nickel transport system permease protein
MAAYEETQPLIRGRNAPALLGRARQLLDGLIDFSLKKPLGAFGAVLVVVFVVVAILGPYVTPHDPSRGVARPLESPSSEHWFGTDARGRDVFSRLIAGATISITVGVSVTLINVLASSFLGMMSGYFLGPVDYLIQRSGEVWGAFPNIIAYFLIISAFGMARTDGGHIFQVAWDMRTLIFALSLGAIFGGSRVIRGATLSIKQTDFVMASRAAGASHLWVMTRHIWPNVFPYVIVAVSASVGGIIIAESALSFLGLGVVPGTPSWGADLSGSNRQYFMQAPWLALAPGLAVSLTVLGLNLFGDGLRDVLDPRMRGSGRVVRARRPAAAPVQAAAVSATTDSRV